MFGSPVDLSVLKQSLQRVLETVEQEKKDRAASYGLLHSHMANFQYDFAVERNERTRLHGDLSALKEDMASMSKGILAIQAPPAAQESVREDVMQALCEQKARHLDLSNLINSVAMQEKSERSSDIARISDIVEGLGKRLETQALPNSNNSVKDTSNKG